MAMDTIKTNDVTRDLSDAKSTHLSDKDLQKVAAGMISEKEYSVYTGPGSSPTLPWWWNFFPSKS
jgi:hypothetical protein